MTDQELIVLMQIMGEKVGTVIDDEDFVEGNNFDEVASQLVADLELDIDANNIILPNAAVNAYYNGILICLRDRTDIDQEEEGEE